MARNLLGKYLARRLPEPADAGQNSASAASGGALLLGRITETEAYVGRCDKACHAFHYRRTARTETLFLPPGFAYVYLIYGMYHCLNFVTEPEGEPAAVLLRAVEPVAGVSEMVHARYGNRPLTPARLRNLCNGPGKVCRAFSITRAENALDLTGDTLFLCDCPADAGLSCCVEAEQMLPDRERVLCGPRIGVDYAEEAKDFPWRFWLEREKQTR
ncbi:MAG: DNA-3-methyladenine glycosylase [Oscillibacter sp.]|nr:DNA-3-methyladenine glycosylase [Oscillibacter sp.]